MSSNKKKSEQLGMSHGTASNRLRKAIMFALVKEAGLDVCFQCGEQIKDIGNLSIEHKIPWLDSKDPAGLFFDLNNIAFSHLKCNIGAGRKQEYLKPIPEHGTRARYIHHKDGCRCDKCRKANAEYIRNRRNKAVSANG